MPTTLAIDDPLIEEARILGKQKNKKAAVNEALNQYIEHKDNKKSTNSSAKLIGIRIMMRSGNETSREVLVDPGVWSWAL